MQFVDIKTAFTSFRGDPSNAFHSDVSSSGVPSDDEIYINSAYQYIANYTTDWPWLEDTDETLDSVAGQQEYTMPSTIGSARVVSVDGIICDPSQKSDVLVANNYNTTPMAGQPRYFYITGDGSEKKIGFHPVKSDNGVNDIYIYGSRIIAPLVDDSDEPLFMTTGGQEYLMTILTGAYYYYLLKETTDRDRQRQSRAIFIEELRSMKKNSVRKIDRPYAITMRPKRRGTYPPEGHIARTPFP